MFISLCGHAVLCAIFVPLLFASFSAAATSVAAMDGDVEGRSRPHNLVVITWTERQDQPTFLIIYSFFFFFYFAPASSSVW